MPAIPEAVAVEARAKIIWGASVKSVLAFLKSENVSEWDARELIETVLAERAEMVRSEGATKAWTGALLLVLPFGYFCLCLMAGRISPGLFGISALVGLFGAARLTQGILMVRNPRSIGGDLSNPDEF